MRCPMCGKSFPPDDSQALPFCSLRCKLADLHGWLGEDYAMPDDIEQYLEEGAEPDEDS